MCGICGCAEHDAIAQQHHHDHEHDHHDTPVSHNHHDIIQVEQDLLARNNQFAAANRAWFLKEKITPINLMSSPGSGKTTLLARTFTDCLSQLNMAVIAGDQYSAEDAAKLAATGAHALQINTGKICHLDAHMVGHALADLPLIKSGILFIENVGNLVCPALFDLGETLRIVLLSVTEGDNKPLKYPDMFRKADLLVLTKIDLLPYVQFEQDKAIAYARRVNPALQVISLSATSGAGLNTWYQWLTNVNP